MKISFLCCFTLATTTTTLAFTNAFTVKSSSLVQQTRPDTSVHSTLSPASYSLGGTGFNGATSPNGINGATTAGTSYGTNAASTPANRRPIVAGNWKLNPTSKEEATELLQGLKASHQGNSDVEVIVFPPLPYLSEALSILEGTGINVGAQTASSFEKGAYTGEIAPSMLSSAGCSYVLLGHSERRTLFGESDSSINDRMKACLKESELKVVLCIGETLAEYEAGLLNSVVDTQLRKGLAGVSAQDLLDGRVVIAYEPVWAIGTGLVATPDQAQAAHVAIRNSLSSMYFDSPNVSSSMRIQYGGSVSPDSVKDLMAMPDVDGALVGGASLVADSFSKIVEGSSSLPPAAPSMHNYIPAPPTTSTAASTAEVAASAVFSHAPVSHFSIDKLESKGFRKGADVGSPHDSTRPLTKVGNLASGSWWCAAGGWPSPNPRATTEIFYVFEGHACVTDMDGTRNFFGPGDVVVLPKGWSGRWDVLEDIHKVWVVVDHPDVTNVDSSKAIIKPYSTFSPEHLDSAGVRADATIGSPVTASKTYLENGYMSTGTWTCSPGSFPVAARTTTEAFHLLEGVAFLTNSDGSARRCVAGDTVVLPKGWTGQWDVIEPVKKMWVTSYL
jgi:triosephosphate isomerase